MNKKLLLRQNFAKISFVFWKNWEQEKLLLKLSHLYYCTRYYAGTLLFSFAKKENSVQSKMFNFASQLMVKSCILANKKNWGRKKNSAFSKVWLNPSFLVFFPQSPPFCSPEEIQVILFQINIFLQPLNPKYDIRFCLVY